MEEAVSRRTDELKVRHRRIRLGGLVASLLVHLVIFLLFAGDSTPRSPFAAAGPRAGDDRAAAAGGGVQVVNLRVVTPRQEVPRPSVPVPIPAEVPEPEEVPQEEEPEQVELAEAPGTGGQDEGPEPGTGIAGGDGQGDGGTDAEGRFRVTPPAPRGLILPPSDRPKKVRGKEVAVWVFVTEEGDVVADSTRLLPSTGDSKFDERLKRQASEWVFQPAKRGDQTVAEWFRYILSL